MSNQRRLHKPIAEWLESKGVKVLPESERFPMPIRDRFPVQHYLHPDVIGIRGTNEVVIVEIETEVRKILEAMGKCMLWKSVAIYVYIAYPKERVGRLSILEAFGIGLLGVADDSVLEVIKLLPDDISSPPSRKVMELNPIDWQRQSESYNQVKRHFEA